MGRYPWHEAVKAFLAGVGPYYGEATLRTMTRGLKVLHDALQELREEGKVSTTSPGKLDRKDIEMILEWMKTRETRNGTGLNSTTRANYLLHLERLLSWVGNPVMTQMKALHYIRFPQKVPSQVSVLSAEEVYALQDALKDMPGWSGSVGRFMVAMYGFSGLRRSELRRARLVDLDTVGWTILVAHPKGENAWATPGVAVILPPGRDAVRAFLQEREDYLRDHGFDGHEALVPYVFRDGSLGYYTDGMWGSVKDDAQRYAGMPFKLQQLRASFAQMCKDRGASIEAVSRALRHSTTVTTERYYARIRPEDAFRELEAVFDRQKRAR